MALNMKLPVLAAELNLCEPLKCLLQQCKGAHAVVGCSEQFRAVESNACKLAVIRTDKEAFVPLAE